MAKHLADAGHEVLDLGTDSADVSVDYPVYGLAVGRAVAEGRAERGVCVCGTGIGIGIAANKVPGVRAAVVHDVTTARWPGATTTPTWSAWAGGPPGSAEAIDAVDTFFSTEFEGGRHQRRIDQITAFESTHRAGDAAPA